MKTEMSPEAADRYLRWAKDFENRAQAYREVRLHGPANDAEAWKGACADQARANPPGEFNVLVVGECDAKIDSRR
jgi:hypothetical protein